MGTIKTLVVLSGGMDSTTLLYKLIAESVIYEVTHCVNFNYGSKHNAKEREKARITCQKLGLKLIEIDMDFINQHFKSDLLQSGGEVPEGHYADENMKKTVVPFRNGIMLSIAAGLAESLGMDAVALGNHSGDHAIYFDCRPEFTNAMKEAICKGTLNQIKLVTPFVGIDKAEIVKIGLNIGVLFQDTYSCYVGGEKACGLCGTCMERILSFYANKLIDPIEYERSWDECIKKTVETEREFSNVNRSDSGEK